MTRTIFAAFFTLVFIGAHAQLLKRQTKVFNAIEGEELFELVDSTQVSLGNVQDSWYNTQIVALVERANWNEGDSTVSAESIIYNSDKQEIGKTLVGFKAKASRIEDVRKYRKHVWVQLEGYVSKRNVHYNSIPEKGLEKIINTKSQGGKQEIFENFFETYEFKKVETSDYTLWVYLDKNASIEEEKPYRAIVIFRGETSLFCVVTNDRPFTMTKLKMTKEDGSGTYYFVSKPNDKAFEAITDEVYSFIPL
jgi:hypothetical protein